MRLFALIGGLLVLLLVAALAVPPFVDWERFKDRFEAEASRVVGQPVRVAGRTSATLLPLPSVTFEQVSVGPENAPLFTARQFDIDVELAPLLKGDVRIVDMAVLAPVVELALDAQGQLVWPADTVASRNLISADEVALDRVTITDGVLRLTDSRTAQRRVVSNIDIEASADALSGPWRGEGAATWRGVRNRLSATSGQWKSSQQVSLRLSVAPQTAAFDYTLDGTLSVANRTPSFEGIARMVRAPAQSDEDRIAFRRPARESALPLALEADLQLGVDEARFPAFKLDVGTGDDPYTVTGTAQASFAEQFSYRVDAEGRQIDLTRLEGASDTATTGSSASSRFAALLDLLRKVPVPVTQGEISLYLPALVAGDTVIRELGFDARPEPGTPPDARIWRIGNLEAQLPGRTELRADGTIDLAAPSFDGSLLLASKQPSGLAKWLGTEPGPALRALRSAGLSTKADISRDRAVLNDLEIITGARRLTGRVIRTVTPNERPQLDARLTGTGLDVGELTEMLAMVTGDESAVASHDLLLDVTADQAEGWGLAARDVVAKGTRRGDAITVDTLTIGDLAGAELAASGALTQSGTAPAGQLSIAVETEDGAALLSTLSPLVGPMPVWEAAIASPSTVADLKMTGELSLNEGTANLKLDGQAGGSRIDADVSATPPPEKMLGRDTISDALLSGRIIFDNPKAAALLGQLGLPSGGNQTGRGAFRATFDGRPSEGMAVDGALTLEQGYASATGEVTMRGDVAAPDPAFSGTVLTESSDLAAFAALFGRPLPDAAQRAAFRAKADVEASGERVVFDNLSGEIGSSSVAGRLTADMSAPGRPVLSGRVSVDEANLDAIFALAGSSETPAALAGIDGTVELAVDRVLQDRIIWLREVKGTVALSDGDVELTDMLARSLGGSLSGTLRLSRNGAESSVTGDIAMRGAQADTVLGRLELPPVIRGKVDLAGRFAMTGADAADLIPSLSGSGRLTMRDGRIEGLSSVALAPLLAQLDAQGDDAAGEGTLRDQAVRSSVLTGSFPIGEATGDISAAAGAVRITSLSLQDNAATLDADARLDLASGALRGTGRLTFEPGRERIAGTTPEVTLRLEGTRDAPELVVETAALSTFLALRASERRERNFVAQQEAVLERQRLQRTGRIYGLKDQARRRAERRARQETVRVAERERRAAEAEAARQELVRDVRAAEEQRLRAEERRLKEFEELTRRAQEAARQQLEREELAPVFAPDG